MIEAMQAKLASITAWQKANLDKVGTLEFRRATCVHTMLNSLVRLNGGTPAQRAYVAQRLSEIEGGTHPLLLARADRNR